MTQPERESREAPESLRDCTISAFYTVGQIQKTTKKSKANVYDIYLVPNTG